jgi:Domain of unknown function (DUF4326)
MPDNATTARVLNKRRDGTPVGSVYIGRLGKWGNPFEIGRDGTRAEVIAKHRAWICDQPALMAALSEIKGRAPLVCHGDTLKELADA